MDACPDRSRARTLSPVLIAGLLACGCATPLSPPEGYRERTDVEVMVLRGASASASQVHVFQLDDHVIVVGYVINDRSFSFGGGRVQVELLARDATVTATGSGSILSLQSTREESAPFRVELRSSERYSACRITVLPDIEGWRRSNTESPSRRTRGGALP